MPEYKFLETAHNKAEEDINKLAKDWRVVSIAAGGVTLKPNRGSKVYPLSCSGNAPGGRIVQGLCPLSSPTVALGSNV